MAKTKELLIQDLLDLQEQNPERTITRDFYRANSKHGDDWSKFFGTFQEFRRQADLMPSRAQQKLERDIAKHASLDTYRDFYKEEVLPYHQKYAWSTKQKGRYKRILYASDFHDIDTDSFSLGVFLDIAKMVQPEVIVFGGDLFDLYEFSNFSKDIRKFSIKERFDFVRKNIFARTRLLCPSAQIDFIIANHEYRLLKLLAEGQNPAVRVLLSDVLGLSLKDIFGLDTFGINLIAKFDLAAFKTEEINREVQQNFQVYFDTVVASHYKDLSLGMAGVSGHTHRPEQYFFSNLPKGKLFWTVTGGMCRREAEYLDSNSKWQNSFALMTIDTFKKRANVEHVIIPENFVVFAGKIYCRPVS